jgi:hypothetical protein
MVTFSSSDMDEFRLRFAAGASGRFAPNSDSASL